MTRVGWIDDSLENPNSLLLKNEKALSFSKSFPMAEHNELGEMGEALAFNWLKKNDFEILHRNWRYSYHEIDIIATKNNLLHIIEVKTRTSNNAGYPEEFVTKKKFKNLQRAAEEYLYQHPEFKNIQFDILAITLPKYKEPEYFLIEDVFL